jgi:hypothetical protein
MSRSRRLLPATRYIYVIGPQNGLQKVGFATDPRSRLASIQTASPIDLVLHASIAVPFGQAHSVERLAHEMLAHCRARNEWFDTTPAEAIAAVHAATGTAFKPSTVKVSVSTAREAWRVRPVDGGGAVRRADLQSSSHRHQSGGQLSLFDAASGRRAVDEGPSPETAIAELGAYRLTVQCCGGVSSHQLGHLAATLPQGGRTPLRQAIKLFRCERCRQTAREAVLVQQSNAGEKRPAVWKVEGRR